MFSSLRRSFGVPGVIAVIALVFAMVGGAFAASGGLTGKQKKEVKSIAKSFQGTGPTGAGGPAGAKGDTGAAGSNGTNGTNGTNGKDGTTGFTETLPSGKTETGSWELPAGPAGTMTVVSFPIPLPATLEGGEFHYVAKGGTPPTECKNEEHAGAPSASNPEAAEGQFCVYAAAGSIGSDALLVRESGEDSGFGTGVGVSTSGAMLIASETVTGGTFGHLVGTWAVSAP